MENLNKIIAKNLTFLRKKSGLKQSELAEKLKYSDKTISKWETGEVVPSIETLVQLSQIYGVTLDTLTHPIDEQSFVQSKDNVIAKRNKIIITLLSVSVVWILATIVFVYSQIISNVNLWTIFVWAIPASCVIGIVFSALWAGRKTTFAIISILIWSLLASFVFQFWSYNIYPILLLGIPSQIVVLLWAGLKRSK